MAIGNRNSGTQVSKNYWDIEASGQTTSEGAAGKTTQEMKTPSTYRWEDIYNPDNNNGKVWVLKEGEYPKLWWEDELEQKSFLLHDNFGNIYTVENELLKPLNRVLPILPKDFANATQELSDIIGNVDKTVDMVKVDNLKNYGVYEYPLAGYSKLKSIYIMGVIGEKIKYIRLISKQSGNIGIAIRMRFFDSQDIQLIPIEYTDVLIESNMNQRNGKLNYDALFEIGTGASTPYYYGNEKAYYILKPPIGTNYLTVRNWDNYTYGKPYYVQVSYAGLDNEDFITIYENTTNGDGNQNLKFPLII